MINEPKPNVLGSAGPAFEQDLQSDDYDRYLVFTYGIDTSLLSQFDADDRVVVCGPSDKIEGVRSTDVAASVTARSVQSHAKLYLMWGADKIVCWLGSFNFTYSGIYRNVEWAARFCGSLETDPTPTDIIQGRVNSKITESWQIQEALELVASTFTGSDTTRSDALLQNTEYPYVLVHSHRSNTLKRALHNELADAAGSVSLTYYSPFVNARGVVLFLETLSPAIRPEDVNLTVRTCRLNEIADQDRGLNSAQVSDFKRELAGFEYQIRAPGDQGDQLRDGRELRAGLAHHKTVILSYLDRAGQERQVTMLTTANLTKNAWQHNSGNFEIGLLLREDSHNDRLHELLGIQLSHCYERPRERELDAAVESTAERASFEDVWLEGLVSEQLQLYAARLSLPWPLQFPTIDSITATVYYRDVLDGSREPETVTLDESADGFSTLISPLSEQQNLVIDFIELDIETPFRPPERRLTGAGINRLQSGELSLSDYPGKAVICDGTSIPVEAFDPDATTAEDIWLRIEDPESRTIKVVHEPSNQPHLAEGFIQNVTTGTIASDDVGGLAYVDVEVDAAITPRHDQLTMRKQAGGIVEYLGYGHPKSDVIRYYFDEAQGGDSLELTVAPPLDRYYSPQRQTERLPHPMEATEEAVQRFTNSEVTAHPVGSAPVIDNETPIEFRSDVADVPQSATVDVQWGLRGYDRFGGSITLNEPLKPRKPHRQVWFRGAASVSVSGVELTLLTRRNAVTIKEQPFVTQLRLREDLLPTHLDLHSLSNHQVLAWLVIDREDLLKPTVRDTKKNLRVTITESDEQYERVACQALDEGELLCLPLLGQHRNRILRFIFELELQGGRPEIAYYAPKQQRLQLEIEASENLIKLSWGNNSHIIRHQQEAAAATLDGLADRVDIDTLAGMLLPDDPFELRDWGRLTLHVREPGLLHFVR